MKSPILVSALLTLALSCLQAQNSYLDSYIREGLESNKGLKQKQLDYAGDLSALKEAKGMFFPDISMNARYTVARGGRTIEFPLGDMLNPVYSTLNILTASEAFPQIENQEFSFYRPTEHETKLSLVQPIFNSDIVQNYRIKKQYAEISRIDVERFERELIREITKAYYEYKRAHKLLALADTSLFLVEENLRVSQKLFENDRVTKDAVYRSESELSKVEVQRAQANNLVETSRAYFNFLLNRSLSAPVELMPESPVPPLVSLEDATRLALQNRNELQQITGYKQLNQHLTSLQKGKNIPGVFGVVDYGFQGEQYSFTSEDDFMLASLVMKWNLFQGTVNRQKVQQSKIQSEKLEELYMQTEQQISLEVLDNFYGLQAAYESVESAGKQTSSAIRAYELINRKYMEGQSSLLELIDARTNVTSAAANSIVATSEYYSRLADFEYAMGANGLENY